MFSLRRLFAPGTPNCARKTIRLPISISEYIILIIYCQTAQNEQMEKIIVSSNRNALYFSVYLLENIM